MWSKTLLLLLIHPENTSAYSLLGSSAGAPPPNFHNVSTNECAYDAEQCTPDEEVAEYFDPNSEKAQTRVSAQLKKDTIDYS